MKQITALFLLLLTGTAAQAVTISNIAYSHTNITHELGGVPNGTTVSFRIDSPGEVQLRVFEAGGSSVIDTATELFSDDSGIKTIFWDALWLIGSEYARQNGTFQFQLILSTTSDSDSQIPATLVQLDSVDIHSVAVLPTLDSAGQPTFPFAVSYSLAKAANTLVRVYNSSNTLVKTLVSGDLKAGEAQQATHTAVWDGTNDSGTRVPTGVYSVTLDATDPGNGSTAIQRVRSMALASLAGGSDGDVQAQFENNIFVYPNPIRDGVGTFQVQAARGGATIRLRIYTLTGDLVKEHDFGSVPVGVVQEYEWHTTNDAGNQVGRGLYYYVVHEEDSSGTLQVTKKLAVIR